MSDATTALVGTTAGTMTAATLAPSVSWAIHGFPLAQMPESTPLLISAALLIGAHALYRYLTREAPAVVETMKPEPHAPNA